MRELEVLTSLVDKLIRLGHTNQAEIYAAEEALKVLKEKLEPVEKDDTAV